MKSLEKSTIEVKFGKMTYYSRKYDNDNPAIILIHGYMSIPSTMLIPPIERYGYNEHSWYFPYLLGTPESSDPEIEEAHSMKQYAEDIYHMILKENLKSVVIIGFSMGGSISILLTDKILQDKDHLIAIKGVFHIEGNIDINDTNFSYAVTQKTVEQFKIERENRWKEISTKFKDDPLKLEWVEKNKKLRSEVVIHRSKDLVRISKEKSILPLILKYPKIPFYFVYGEKNKGTYSSEQILRENRCEVIYIPNSKHYVFEDNPQYFLDLVYRKIEEIEKGNKRN